jgi:hypothetical protein
MKSPSLNSIYDKLKKHILLVESYTELKQLSFIIKACRLKPFSYFFEEKKSKLILYRWWFDEFGNSFKIVKNKQCKIIYNDLSLDLSKIACTDLYYGLSLEQIAKMSKLFFICAGKDEDTLNNVFLISFLGIDDYLRTFLYMYGEWQQVSSLYLGLGNLKAIGKNLDIKYFLKLNKKENIVLPCIQGEAWLTYLPANNDFLRTLEKQYDFNFSFLNHQKG